MQENPQLPVVPMIDSNIVTDDSFPRWMGVWGSATKSAYLITDERVFIRDYDDEEDVLSEVYGWDAYEEMSDEEAEDAYENLSWTEAIIVNIDA